MAIGMDQQNMCDHGIMMRFARSILSRTITVYRYTVSIKVHKNDVKTAVVLKKLCTSHNDFVLWVGGMRIPLKFDIHVSKSPMLMQTMICRDIVLMSLMKM